MVNESTTRTVRRDGTTDDLTLRQSRYSPPPPPPPSPHPPPSAPLEPSLQPDESPNSAPPEPCTQGASPSPPAPRLFVDREPSASNRNTPVATPKINISETMSDLPSASPVLPMTI